MHFSTFLHFLCPFLHFMCSILPFPFNYLYLFNVLCALSCHLSVFSAFFKASMPYSFRYVMFFLWYVSLLEELFLNTQRYVCCFDISSLIYSVNIVRGLTCWWPFIPLTLPSNSTAATNSLTPISKSASDDSGKTSSGSRHQIKIFLSPLLPNQFLVVVFVTFFCVSITLLDFTGDS